MSTAFECSLLIPCFDAAPYLLSLIECVRAQEHSFKEVLFYDDGSSDSTSRIITDLGYTPIRGDSNRGVSYARNRLIEAATCDWIHFHDADDLMEKSFLAEMSKVIHEDRSVYLCQSDWLDADHGNVQTEWRYSQDDLSENPLIAVLQKPVSTLNAIYPKTLLEEVKGFDETVTCWEDADLNIRIAERGYSFRVVDQVLVKSLRRRDSSSVRQGECEECRYKLLKSYKERMDKHLYPILAEEFEQTARRALRHKNYALARSALASCKEVGGEPPTSSNKLFQFLKKIFPSYWLLFIQSFIRG